MRTSNRHHDADSARRALLASAKSELDELRAQFGTAYVFGRGGAPTLTTARGSAFNAVEMHPRSPRAMKVTSSRACARCAPMVDPIAPAPRMTIFIASNPSNARSLRLHG
jgi:hypothetical protein